MTVGWTVENNNTTTTITIRATANTGASQSDVAEAFQHVAIYAGVAKANHAIKLAKQTYAEMTGSDKE